MFDPDLEMLDRARAALAGHRRVFWVIGGACAGKSTICEAVSAMSGVQGLDMDDHVYGSFQSRYDPLRHPASTAWFARPDPLAWALSLTREQFDDLNRAATVEILYLFAEDMADRPIGGPLLVDGGVTHPSILAQVVPPERVFCVAVDPDEGARIWNEDPARSPMKQAVHALPDGTAAWETFLDFDRLISETMVRESRELGIPVHVRDPGTTVEETAREALARFGLTG